MNLKYRLSLIILLLFSFGNTSMAQVLSDSIHFSGIVYDADSITPITNVHVSLNEKGTSTTNNGQFSFWIQKGDSLRFSHISYQNFYWLVPDTIDNPDMLLGLFMSKDTSVLAEIVIYPRLPELESLMTKQVKEDQDIRNAKNNLNIMAYQARHNRVTTWDAEMNTDMKLRGYEMSATYNGLLPPDEIVPITAIVPLAIALVRQKYNSQHQEMLKVTPLEEDLIKTLFTKKKN